jgi:transposase-like protein
VSRLVSRDQLFGARSNDGFTGWDSIAELCRKEGINQNLYYRWSKEFLEAGKNGSPATRRVRRPRTRVKELKGEARQLKETLAEVLIENRPLKKAFSGMGGRAQQHLMSATSSSSSCMPSSARRSKMRRASARDQIRSAKAGALQSTNHRHN